MNKTIIVLTGEPEQKNQFLDKVKDLAWINNFNPKSYLWKVTEHIREEKERDEEYWNFLAEFLKLANRYFDYEEVSTRKKIKEFLADNDEVKNTKEGKKFDKFLLIIHGLSRNIRETLKNEYPLYVIRLATSNQPSNEMSQDFVLETDVSGYEDEVKRVIEVLTSN